VYFCSISIFDILRSKGWRFRFGSDFCFKIVDGTLTEGRFDFFCVILLYATIHFDFFACFSTVDMRF
jgi:hypothetical protein